ncbi:imidazole glycerol phosphate synthase subunit HisF [Corallococcus sp. H22C18031201]|uniref:imidazole glycerol phosphate synthase subunit HisF n=1 Tax=Citreicoccus inhibens TaxID=2849499 RepID=UPI000E753FD3|nr:imidazole glycerol phosphate synthase subunit HisF [Citreicoccus inhibens]MBU8898560.1 imidazole glycerol phosphate synthase subunit HisF [Citreicoccus inhibens]RJS24986.1 imidazole glycerol phosphate synthase subunit HisF [Corallococcus sp. H22C18031201]
MLARRLIVCLDVKDGRVVKGVRFEGLRDMGDPVSLARRYEAEGADEVTFLDISATEESRATLWALVQRTAERLFIPLTVGGGVRTVEDAGRALRAGADKVCLNSAAVANPAVLTACAERFGSQAVVASIDAKREAHGWRVYTHGGRRRTDWDAVAWARECVRRGAGEVLLTSVDRDGLRQGYDVALTRAVSSSVDVPVIASGGAGSGEHVRDALREGGADAALVAGILHEGVTTVSALKATLRDNGIEIRSQG